MADQVNTPVQWQGPKEVPIHNPKAGHATEPIDNLHLSEGIPKEMLSLFEIDLTNTDLDALSKLREISDWAFDGQTFIGDGMIKLTELVEKIPSHIKDKHNHVWNLVRLQKQIERKRNEVNDLESRKEALMRMGSDHRRPY